MRTTILLPDDLYDEVRMTAARERRTITSVIEQALRDALHHREQLADRPAFRVDVIHGAELLPGIDLDDGSALLDAMDER